MGDYLLEIGCEEIPARMVDRAVADLAAALSRRLQAEALAPQGEVSAYGGPRRLAVLLRGLPDRQPDRSERLTGPPVERAFDASGTPTAAALGFARKLGIEAGSLERVATPKGECVAGVREIPGEVATQVLARIVPEVVLGLSFAKTMRWGNLDVRFVRALRSLVSLLDSRVVDLEIARVRAGRTSFGHRFLGAREVKLERAADYRTALAAEHVLVAADERRRAIESGLAERAAAAGGQIDRDPDLLAEVVHLVEEPHVVAGRFDPAYLELPCEVLVTSMKHHQKSFPVWKEPGVKLAPAVLAVANIPDAEGHVARGYERVLNARLADARFFWQEDRKQPLAARLPRLEKVVLHERLGSTGAKVRRLQALAPAVARHFGLGVAAEQDAAEAARLAKADLVTGMVGEFAELQGVVGGLILAAEGASKEVARAVYEHYRPLSLEGEPPASAAGRALAIADKLDTLVGFFAVGLIPSGTKDPFGLRRATQGVIRTTMAQGLEGSLEPLLAETARLHRAEPGAGSADGGLEALAGYFSERLEHVLSGLGHAGDTLACVLAVSPLDVVDAARRADALSGARRETGFEETFSVFKRVANIAGLEGDTAYDPACLREEGERELEMEFERARAEAEAALSSRDYARALAGVRRLAGPIHRFFERIFVMDPDPTVRENRLRLLRAVGQLVRPLGDFRRLQVEREGREKGE